MTWSGRRPGLVVVATVVAAAFALPFAYLAWRGLSGGSLEVLGTSAVRASLRRTLELAVAVSVAAALLGTSLAWLVSRTDLPGRRVWRLVFALPLVIPSFIGAFAMVAGFAPGGLFADALGFSVRMRGFGPTFVVLALLTYPYVYLTVVARLSALPASIEESARSLGRSPRTVFATIVLPQTTGAIAAGSLLVFLYVVSEFGAVSILRYDTLAVRVYSSRLFAPATSMAVGLLLAVIALLVVAAERAVARRRQRTEAMAAGRPALRTPLGVWKLPALFLAMSVVATALLAPMAVLAAWAWRGLDGTRVGGRPVDAADLAMPVRNTATAALVAALVAIIVVLPIAYLMRRQGRWSASLHAVVVAGFALPGLVIALALASSVLQVPLVGGLYQTFPILVYAYVVHFGAQALGAADVAVGSVPRRLDDAARSLGARRPRRFLTVDLPLVLPGLAAGGGLVLLSTMKELPATLLLAPIGFETLATRTWFASENGLQAEAGLTALVLVALSAVLTWLFTIRRLGRLS